MSNLKIIDGNSLVEFIDENSFAIDESLPKTYELGDIQKYIDAFPELQNVQIMDCTGCIHKGNKSFCLNCKRGGCRDYYLTEEE